MKMSDMRAKARAIFGSAIAEPMPKQPNGAKALQERANARPIPTYKVGGAVKKNAPPGPTAAEREADRKRREEYAKMKVSKEQGDAITRGNRSAATERPGYKTGGKVQTSADTAKKLATEMGGMKKGGKAKDGLAVMIAIGNGGKIKEKGSGEMYSSKKSMAKHEAAESAGMERMEHMKKPVKKMAGGMMSRDMTPADMSSYRMAEGGMKEPIKRAAGGAAKVRKGMMTPEGKITHAMNKIRGK